MPILALGISSVAMGDPGWSSFDALDKDCRLERATDPQRVSTLQWVSCTDGNGVEIEDCRVSRDEQNFVVAGAWHEHGLTWLRMLRGSHADGRSLAISELDGPILAAFREPAQHPEDPVTCFITAIAVGGGRAAFVAQFLDRTTPRRSLAGLFVAPLDRITQVREPTYVFPTSLLYPDRTITRLWVSSSFVALQTSPDGLLYRYRDGELELLNGSKLPGLAQHVTLIGDHLLWESWQGTDYVELAHAPKSSKGTIWRDRSGGETKSFGTDGADMAWMQCRGRRADGSYEHLELWTATYRDDLGRIEPRRVCDLHVRNGAAVGGGWYAMRRTGDGPQRIDVFSLRDGTRRTFIPPGGLVLDDPFYVSEHEIMFPGRGTIRFDPSRLPSEQ